MRTGLSSGLFGAIVTMAAHVDQKHLAYKHRGRTEAPVVVLLHGLFGRAENLGGIARELAAHFSVYSLDLPGHGRSAPTSAMSLTGMAGAVLASCAELSPEPVHIIGHSLGGKVAMQCSALKPENFSSVIVLDIAPVNYSGLHAHDDIFAAVARLDKNGAQSRAEVDALLAADIAESDVRQFILTNLIRGEDQRYHWQIDFQLLRENYRHFAAAPEEAEVYHGPTLAVKGELSAYMQARHETSFRRRFSQLEFKQVQGAGHWLHAEKPGTVNALIKQFYEDNHFLTDKSDDKL